MEHWRSAVEKVKTWSYLNKESKPMPAPPSQTGWLVTIGAVQNVWRKVSEEHKFKFLETRNLNQGALENTFGAIRLHCGSNSNPSVGQFVDALKTVIINGLTYRSLYGTNCEDDGAPLLDKLYSFLKPSNVSSTSPSTSHDSETTDIFPDIVHIGEEARRTVSAAVRACTLIHGSLQVLFCCKFVLKIYRGTSVLCGISFISFVEPQFLVYV
jgi:hypothetical protein